MKNKLLKTLFLIIMVFSLSVCTDVRANTDKQDATTKPGFYFGSTTRDYWWDASTYVGIRITIVNADGTRVRGTKSGDYFTTYSYSNSILTETHANLYKSMPSKYWYNKIAAVGGMRKEVILQIESDKFELSEKTGNFQTLNFLPFMNIKGTSWEQQVTEDYFEKYFKNMNKTTFENIFETLSNGVKSRNEICTANDWYFVIEPVTSLYLNPGRYVGTITELAYILQKSDQNRISYLGGTLIGGAQSIYMEGTIQSFTGFTKANFNNLLSITDIYTNSGQGYAVGVYKISDIYDNCLTTCYKPETTCDTTSCDNVAKNNVRTCKKTMTSYECEYDEVDYDYNSAGEKTFTITDDCSLYCTETATVSYPGNVSPAIGIYESFAWPTRNGKYPLTTNAVLKCEARMNDGSNANQTCLDALKKKEYNYSDKEDGAYIEYDNIEKKITANLKGTCTSKKTLSTSGKEYTIERDCTYELDPTKNIAIDKKTAQLLDKASLNYASGVSNWILMQNGGVLPESGYSWVDDSGAFENLYDKFSGTDTFKKNYCLEVKDLSVGYNGAFKSELSNTPYVCSYNITLAPQTSCVCPPGTEYSGTDLYGAIKDTAENCAEAIEIYCNDGLPDEPDEPDEYCPPESDHPERTCTEYVKNGGTEEDCIEFWCNDPCEGENCKYVCPDDSDFPGMDINDCVSGELAKGKNYVEAKSYCIDDKCYKNKGLNIIYRTISLENPFPSKDADANVNQNELTIGMFNTTIKGRYPGSNWNSVTLVKNKILNNRGYNGSEIYQEAKPLYVIELDPTAIKKIREYNKNQEDKGGYADFTLNCTNGAYCISSFIRSGITTATGNNILTGGTCATAHNKTTFTECYK